MLARKILSLRLLRLFLLAAGVVAFSSCATKPEPQLVSDGRGRESTLPWNKQEKWENSGQFGAMADNLQSR